MSIFLAWVLMDSLEGSIADPLSIVQDLLGAKMSDINDLNVMLIDDRAIENVEMVFSYFQDSLHETSLTYAVLAMNSQGKITEVKTTRQIGSELLVSLAVPRDHTLPTSTQEKLNKFIDSQCPDEDSRCVSKILGSNFREFSLPNTQLLELIPGMEEDNTLRFFTSDVRISTVLRSGERQVNSTSLCYSNLYPVIGSSHWKVTEDWETILDIQNIEVENNSRLKLFVITFTIAGLIAILAWSK